MGLNEFLLIIAVGGGIIAVLFATFRGAAAEAGGRSAESGEEAGADAVRSDLEERRRAALESVTEIESDYEAGNLSTEDYESLRGRYAAEVVLLDQQLDSLASRPASGRSAVDAASSAGLAARRGSWTQRVGWAAGSLAFLALAWLVMSQTLRPRGEGDTITGSLPGQDEPRMGGRGAAVSDVDPERLAALEQRVAENANDLEALLELGHLYLQLQRYPELAELTRGALALDPNNPEALTHLGMLLFSTSHPQGVMETFDRALQTDPDFAEALQFKGMVAFIGQDYATAVEAWERYLAVVPPEKASPRIRGMLEAARANAGSGSEPTPEEPQGSDD